MSDRAAFPDVEAHLRTFLADLVGGSDSTGTVTPDDLQDAMPFLRIQRFGGEDDGWTDSALVAIDAFAADRPTAIALAEAVRQRLLTPGAKVVDGVGSLDYISTATAPNEVPWSESQDVRRFAASYRITARR